MTDPAASHCATAVPLPFEARLPGFRWTSQRTRGGRLVRHALYAIFQFAEAALPRQVLAGMLALINGLRGPPAEAASA